MNAAEENVARLERTRHKIAAELRSLERHPLDRGALVELNRDELELVARALALVGPRAATPPPCPTCNGHGTIRNPDPAGVTHFVPCPTCHPF